MSYSSAAYAAAAVCSVLYETISIPEFLETVSFRSLLRTYTLDKRNSYFSVLDISKKYLQVTRDIYG